MIFHALNIFFGLNQVEDVNAKFDALEKLKENNWQEEEKKTRKITRKTKPKVLIDMCFFSYHLHAS